MDFIALTRKNKQKHLKGPFSHKVWRIFFIFDRVNPYNDTNNFCKFRKSRLKNVDFIA